MPGVGWGVWGLWGFHGVALGQKGQKQHGKDAPVALRTGRDNAEVSWADKTPQMQPAVLALLDEVFSHKLLLACSAGTQYSITAYDCCREVRTQRRRLMFL